MTKLSMHGTKGGGGGRGGRPGGLTARVLSPPLRCVTLRTDSSAPPVALMLRPLEPPAQIQASTHIWSHAFILSRYP